MNIIKTYVDVGFKVAEKGKPTMYFGDQTDNGVCYKDVEAFRNGSDICYIPEGELLENWEADLNISDLGYRREDILNLAREYVGLEGIPVEENFVEYLAECVLHNVDWQSIGTCLEVTDISEEWEYYKEKTR